MDQVKSEKVDQAYFDRMESLSNMALGIHHELNNLFSLISGRLALLEEGLVSDPKLLLHTKSIRNVTDRGFALMKAILAFSGRQIIERDEVDINKVIVEITQTFQMMDPGEIEVVLNLDPSLTPVLLDKIVISDVILNLLQNAKRSVSKNGKIAIETKKIFRCEKYLRISIGDTGNEIDQKKCEKIFEPFFVSDSFKRGALDLPAVYGSVKAHSGFVELHRCHNYSNVINVFLPILEFDSKIDCSVVRSGNFELPFSTG